MRSADFGVSCSVTKIDLQRIMERKDVIVRTLRERGREAIISAGIELIEGVAGFESANEIKINGQSMSADNFIIASGSVPVIPEINGLKDTGYITSDEALNIKDLPESIVILGCSYVGLEFATFLNSLGVRTTMVEVGGRIASKEDEEISMALHYYLTTQLGIEIYTRSVPKSVRREEDHKIVALDTPDGAVELHGEEILLAVGRRPFFDDLNIEAAGIQTGRKGIPVDEYLRTNVGHIYAVGDVTGSYQLAHFASYEGGIAGTNAVKGDRQQVSYRVVPRAIFCYPEVASVGMTEIQAKQEGIDTTVMVESFAGKGKPVVMSEEWGFIKLVADAKTRELIGAHIIGPQASDLIHEFAVEIEACLPVDSAARTIHIEPTLSMVSGEAMEELDERLEAA